MENSESCFMTNDLVIDKYTIKSNRDFEIQLAGVFF
jgi:hypothetical protein